MLVVLLSCCGGAHLRLSALIAADGNTCSGCTSSCLCGGKALTVYQCVSAGTARIVCNCHILHTQYKQMQPSPWDDRQRLFAHQQVLHSSHDTIVHTTCQGCRLCTVSQPLWMSTHPACHVTHMLIGSTHMAHSQSQLVAHSQDPLPPSFLATNRPKANKPCKTSCVMHVNASCKQGHAPRWVQACSQYTSSSMQKQPQRRLPACTTTLGKAQRSPLRRLRK